MEVSYLEVGYEDVVEYELRKKELAKYWIEPGGNIRPYYSETIFSTDTPRQFMLDEMFHFEEITYQDIVNVLNQYGENIIAVTWFVSSRRTIDEICDILNRMPNLQALYIRSTTVTYAIKDSHRSSLRLKLKTFAYTRSMYHGNLANLFTHVDSIKTVIIDETHGLIKMNQLLKQQRNVLVAANFKIVDVYIITTLEVVQSLYVSAIRAITETHDTSSLLMSMQEDLNDRHVIKTTVRQL